MKRVYCLYRVSTKGQVEKDDIPMQKQACHEFVAEQSDWHIEKEFSEKGVSGFKIAAKDRDAIQDLQKAAVEKKFDVLLVFMFDRIGRKEDETPFVVEWFVRQGVEVWSVKEGQQRFDTHVDKLLNYIRFWQASGESIKTSIRTRTRMEQLVKEGHFKGEQRLMAIASSIRVASTNADTRYLISRSTSTSPRSSVGFSIFTLPTEWALKPSLDALRKTAFSTVQGRTSSRPRYATS